ncbi:MAG: HAD-IIB family hydrolase [Culicoidibacterales bacterium]
MVKYFICDLDGTLIRNRQVSAADKAAIAQFIAAGGEFIIATGRADFEIENFAKFENIGPVSYRISCNGAVIRTADGELVFHQRLSDQASQLMRRELELLEGRFSIVEASDVDWVYYHGTIDEDDIYKDNHTWEDTDVVHHFGETIFPIKYFIQGDSGAIQHIVTTIQHEMPQEFEIFNDIHEVNVGPKHISKGTAVEHFLTSNGIKAEEIAVIGDAANDIAMFGTTPNSFTFHHASEAVQQHANYIVDSVAEALEQLTNNK